MIDRLQPDDLVASKRYGFMHVVSAQAERLVWIAGQTSCDQSGRPVGGDDAAAQASAALDNLGRALAAAGAGPADVTMLRVYVVGFSREIAQQIAGPVAKFFAATDPPASTWIGVQSLMHPAFLIEIDAVAVVDAAPSPR